MELGESEWAKLAELDSETYSFGCQEQRRAGCFIIISKHSNWNFWNKQK